ncbi:MAG: zinc-dependent alcohol dehydrogenase [Actinomycetota bacterium]
MIASLEMYRSVPKYLAARALGDRVPGLLAGPAASLRFVHRETPSIEGQGWALVRPILSGICGSDLTTISGQSSFYFSSLVSMPFVPGHEIVGTLLDDCEDLKAGARVVVDPILACAARGVTPQCGPCTQQQHHLCERVTGGHVSAGLQTGYCDDTSGGWSETVAVHRSQLHVIPESMSDEDAVMVEPLACAIHAVRRASIQPDARVLVVGAGTVGLLTTLALRAFTRAGQIIVVAKHARQAALARELGASDVASPSTALALVRRTTSAFRLHPERSTSFLLGGVDVAFDAAGSASTLDLALKATKARGSVVLAGMPPKVDLTPAWFRELTIIGAYSGAGAFEDSIKLSQESNIGRLVSATYPLESWREAIDHALAAGKLGSIKIAFKPEGTTRQLKGAAR